MVLSFLQHLRHLNLQNPTLLILISILSSFMNEADGVLVVGHHPLAVKSVLGDRSPNIPQRSLIPPQDFPVVLVVLTEQPFEPMPKNFTLKVLFL